MNPFVPLFLMLAFFALVFVFTLFRSIRVVPNRTALIVERLGKYSRTLEAGFHILFPFLDKVRYKQNLKEQSIDVPAQDCFTKDNVQVRVDGMLYLQVIDPKKGTRRCFSHRRPCARSSDSSSSTAPSKCASRSTHSW